MPASDLAAAMSDKHDDVPAFEGRDVAQTTVAVSSLGDGLSDAMAIQRRHLRIGDRVVLVVEGIVVGSGFKPVKGYDATEQTAPLNRTAKIRAGQVYFADGDEHVEQGFAQQRLALEQAEAAAAAQQGIPAETSDWETEDSGMYGDGEDGEGGTVHDLPPR